jgi:hypothetical protein
MCRYVAMLLCRYVVIVVIVVMCRYFTMLLCHYVVTVVRCRHVSLCRQRRHCRYVVIVVIVDVEAVVPGACPR